MPLHTFPGLACWPTLSPHASPCSADMLFPIHLGEVDHLDRDHGLQEPGRGEMRAEAALSCGSGGQGLNLTHVSTTKSGAGPEHILDGGGEGDRE